VINLDRDFGEACGLRAPLRLVVTRTDEPGSSVRVLDRPCAVIGRAPLSDLMLDHPDVGGRHVYLQVVDGRAFGIDLESRTGTLWEGKPRVMGWLDVGEALQIGPFQVRLQHEDAWAGGGPGPGRLAAADRMAPPTSRSFATPGLTEGFLEFLDPEAGHRIWQVSRALVLVGRFQICRIQLTGADVSGVHCALVRTPEGIWVVDLLGRCGTVVNGRPVRSARLEEGDELRVGLKRFRLHHGTAPTLPARRPASPLDPLTPEISSDPVLRPGLDDAALTSLFREFGQMQQQMADQFQQALMMMFQMFSGMHQDQMNLIREELARVQKLTEQQRLLQAELDRNPASERARPTLRVVVDEAQPNPALAARDAPFPLRGPLATSLSDLDPGELHADLVRRLAAIQQERQGGWQKLLDTLKGRGSG
jgi:pSer/pThr/pTyr-binding forkhead associated (FHA) protein